MNRQKFIIWFVVLQNEQVLCEEWSKCSWILCEVLRARDAVQERVSYILGDGNHTSFWFDSWHGGQPIYTSLDDPIISYNGLSSNTKVAVVLSSTGQELPVLNHHDMIIWRQSFSPNYHFDLNKRDDILWDNISLKKVKASVIWQSTRNKEGAVSWASGVWHRLYVRRYSCHHQLIMHGRVNTLSRLKRLGLVQNDSCCFCINGSENIQHLFVECPFTQHLFKLVICGKCLSLSSNWLNWYIKLENFPNREIFCTIQVLISYLIWRERSNSFYGGEICSPGTFSSCNNPARLLSIGIFSVVWPWKKPTHRITSLEIMYIIC